MPQPLCLATLAFAIACWTAPALAGPGDATRLEYERSESAVNCPDRAALKSAVSKRLGYDPFFPAARQTILVEITDARDGDGLHAQMRLLDDQGIIMGSRELRDGSGHCDELVASLALAISIALDPSAALEASPEPRPAPAEPKADVPVTADANFTVKGAEPRATDDARRTDQKTPKRATRPPQQADTPALAFRGSGVIGFGVGPATALAFRVGAGVGRHWFRIVAEFTDQLPTSRDETTFGGSVRASLLAGSLAPCFVWRAFDACALAQLGGLRSEGRDVENASVSRSVSAALGGRAEYVPLLFDHVRLLFNADVLKSLTPVTLQLAGKTLWTTPNVAAQAGVGVEVLFP